MHTMFNRNRYYRDQMKSRKVFKDSLDYMKSNDYNGVTTTENELVKNDFGVWDKGLKMIQLIVLVLFLIVVFYLWKG